jgi:translation initiation factor IF-2
VKSKRLHEVAKELGFSSKKAAEILGRAGIDVKSHIEIINEAAYKILQKASDNDISDDLSDDNDTSSSSQNHNSRGGGRRGGRGSGRNFRRRGRENRAPERVEASSIEVEGSTPLYVVADLMGRHENTLIFEFLKRGKAYARTQLLSVDEIEMLGQALEVEIVFVGKKSTEVVHTQEMRTAGGVSNQKRWPVVVVMGHVDHGKTTLLDYLRKSSVAQKEKGGITQHLGAYEVEGSHGRAVFIDTPGHEAFAAIRGRGVTVTDLVVLVVAIDDGVKPQTIEAIKHAQGARLPIIIAANKIDKGYTDDQMDRLKRQLSEQDILVEDWGGEAVIVPISAQTGQGIDDLLEIITLQMEMLEPSADPTVPAKFFVLESRIDRGLGPVATVIPIEGTLRRGDCFIANQVNGKVRLMLNSAGEKVAEAGPSVPVQITGFNALPSPGDVGDVVAQQVYSRARSSSSSRPGNQAPGTAPAQEASNEAEAVVPYRILVKADAQGSADAVVHLIEKLKKTNAEARARLQVVYTGVGDINENDIVRADAAQASVVGFYVRADRNALSLAKERELSVKQFDVIYHLTEYLEEELLKTKAVVKVSKKIGEAEVRKVFVLKDKGIIAGCYVSQGSISRTGRVVCMRDGAKIGEDEITSLQRDRKTMKEVVEGYECAFICKDYHDWQVGDIAECYIEVEQTD